MPTLKERSQEIAVKMGELDALYTKHKTGDKDPDTGNPVFSDDIPLDETNRRGAELKALRNAYELARSTDAGFLEHEAEMKRMAEMKRLAEPQRRFRFSDGGNPGDDEPAESGIKTVTKKLVESDGYKRALAGEMNSNGWSTEIKIPMFSPVAAQAKGVKSLFSESGGGIVPYPTQQPYFILSPQRRLVVADLIPQSETDQPSIVYLEETTFTNNAAAVSEGALKPSSALGTTRRTVYMTKVATTIKVTDETMMDIPRVQAYLENRLGFMVGLEEERELLLGSGTAPEMTGFLNKAGINTQAQASDDVFTAVYKLITKVNSTTGFAQASGIVINPNNWVTFRTTKDAQGRFILGDPGAMGADMLWGLPVVATPAETLGSVLAGDFLRYSHIDRKLGLTLNVGYENDDFTRNQSTIRAEERLALEIWRPLAFGVVTGIA